MRKQSKYGWGSLVAILLFAFQLACGAASNKESAGVLGAEDRTASEWSPGQTDFVTQEHSPSQGNATPPTQGGGNRGQNAGDPNPSPGPGSGPNAGFQDAGQAQDAGPAPDAGITNSDTDSSGGGGSGKGEGTPGGNPAPPPEEPDRKAPTNPAGEKNSDDKSQVEEADLQHLVGSRLYYLSTYKGLLVLDISRPSSPKKLATLPIYGVPLEMYVQGNRAYILVRDALALVQNKGSFSFQRKNVSQLVTVDITKPDTPKILYRYDILGQIRAGVSRKIDDMLYLVATSPKDYVQRWSYQGKTTQEQTTFYALDLSDPKGVRERHRMVLGATFSPTPLNPTPEYTKANESVFQRTLQGLVLSATKNRLLVAERWLFQYRSSNPSCSRALREFLRVHVIALDGSSPKPPVTRFTLLGTLQDQQKHALISTASSSAKDFYVGMVAQRPWDTSRCRQGALQNKWISVALSQEASPKLAASLLLEASKGSPQASALDTNRGLAYLQTLDSQGNGSLSIIDFRDPTQPQVRNTLQGFTSPLKWLRPLSQNGLVLGLSQGKQAQCNTTTPNHFSVGVVVHLFDASEASRFRQVQQACITVRVPVTNLSDVQWDFDQAHKRIALHQTPSQTLLTVPVSYQVHVRKNNQDYTEYRTAVGLLRLRVENVTANAAPSQILESLATIEHPKGIVQRSLFLQPQKLPLLLLNLSETTLSIVELASLANPRTLATLEIAPYVNTVYRFGDALVEQVNLGRDFDYYNEFRVKSLKQSNLADAPVLASFREGKLQSVIRKDPYLLLFVQEKSSTKTHATLKVVDFSQPYKPKFRGTLKLPAAFVPQYRYYCGNFHTSYSLQQAQSETNETHWVLTTDGIAALVSIQNNKTFDTLLTIEIRNPDHPVMKEYPLSPGREALSLVSLSPKRFFLVNRTQLRETTRDGQTTRLYRYYAQSWIHQNRTWHFANQVNLPGRLNQATQEGTQIHLLTHVLTLEPLSGKPNPHLHWLSLDRSNQKATLLRTRTFLGMQLNEMILDGKRLYVNAGTPSTHNQPTRNHLLVFQLHDDRFDTVFSSSLQTENLRLMGVYQQKLFFILPGEGLLVGDFRFPSSPKALSFQPTQGWAKTISFFRNEAIVSSGHYGIYRLPLKAN